MPNRLLILALIIISLSQKVNAFEVVSAGPNGRYIASAFFGMHVRYGVTKTPWPYAQFNSWRLITPETEWRGVQPQRDVWKFDQLDHAVALSEEHNTELLLTLGQTPQWAASRPHEIVPNGPGSSSEPANMEDWRNYVREVARRYRGKIKYYELWNEPRFREIDPYRAVPGFTGYAAKMVEMGLAAKLVLAEEDPTAILISPAIDAGFIGLKRVEQWFRSGGGEVTPILSYHFYLRPPERMSKLYRELRKITTQAGYPNMPIWNTESGYFVQNPERPTAPLWPGSDDVFAKVLTPEENAAYMVRAHLITAAAGLDRFYWYSWDILNMGLTRSFGTIQTSGSVAYGSMLRWLRFSVIKDCVTENDKTWICRLRRNDASAYVVWNVQGDEEFAIPEGMSVGEAESISGLVTQITGNKVSIGISPILLRAKGVAWLPKER